MFYENKLSPRKVKKLAVKFDKFELPPEPAKNPLGKSPSTASECYNFRVENGALVDGYGFEDLSLPDVTDTTEKTIVLPSTEIKKIWNFKWFEPFSQDTKSFVFYMGENNHIYYFLEHRFGTLNMIEDSQMVFESIPCGFYYRVDTMPLYIFSSPTDDLKILNVSGYVFNYENMPKMADFCVHENSIYIIPSTDDSTVLYTDDFKYPSVTDTTFSELVFRGGEGGRLRKLISLDDYVYVFRDNAIVKIYPYSSGEELSMTNVYYSTAYIMPETIQRCGDEIVYLTREGLYAFNGSTSKKISLEVTDKIDMTSHNNFVSASQKGKYYLACKMNFDDETVACENTNDYVNNAVLIYDVNSGCVEIMRGLDIRDFEVFESGTIAKLLCCFHGDNKAKIGQLTTDGKLFGQTLPRKWTSVQTDFGYSGKKKIVRSVTLLATNDAVITLQTEEGTYDFPISGNSQMQKVKLGVKGETFKISFSSTVANQKIASPEFDIDVLL